jgi:hypothetical protein
MRTHEFEANLGYIARPYLKKRKKIIHTMENSQNTGREVN